MKYFTSIILGTIVFAILSSCGSTSDSSNDSDMTPDSSNTIIVGDKKIVTKDMTPDTDFVNFDISNQAEVTFQQGAQMSVEVTANENIYNYMTVEGRKDVFVITLANDYQYQDITFEVVITTSDLFSINEEGAVDCSILNYDFYHDVTLTIKGASSTSASNSSIHGNLALSVDRASTANLEEMYVLEDANVEISGASTVWVDVTGQIFGSISGGSILWYKNATISSSFEIEDPISCKVERY